MKKTALFICVLVTLISVKILTAGISDIEQVDGQQRQKIIDAAGSGGGGLSTNQATISWSGTNNFLGPVNITGKLTASGITNFINTANFVIGTNSAPADGWNMFVDFRSRGAVTTLIEAQNGAAASQYFGHYYQGVYEQKSQSGTTLTTYGVGMTTFDDVFYSGGTRSIYANSVAAGNLRARASVSGFAIGPQGVAVTNMPSATMVADPPSLLTTTSFTTNITCTGAIAGNSPCIASSDYITNGITYFAYCLTNDTIMVDIRNVSAGTIDAPSQTIRVLQFGIR